MKSASTWRLVSTGSNEIQQFRWKSSLGRVFRLESLKIGRATAILFAREGAKVAIAEIDAQAGDETAHLAGNEAIAIRADVTDPDSLQSAIRATVDKFGRLEVLHNNAGGSTAQDDTAVNAIAYGPLVSTSLFSVEGHLVRATFNG
jgi:NAD(P)-dependent dehydrogenase (short-subunit alcohol dehydrogenase family)